MTKKNRLNQWVSYKSIFIDTSCYRSAETMLRLRNVSVHVHADLATKNFYSRLYHLSSGIEVEKATPSETIKRMIALNDSFRLDVEVVPVSPPPPSSFWLSFLIPHDRSDDLVLALEDAFPRWLERYGERKAKWIFCAQTFGVIASFHWSKIRAGVIAIAGKFGLDLIKGWFTTR